MAAIRTPTLLFVRVNQQRPSQGYIGSPQTSGTSQAGVEQIAQGVAKHVDPIDDDGQAEAGKKGQQGLAFHILAGVVDAAFGVGIQHGFPLRDELVRRGEEAPSGRFEQFVDLVSYGRFAHLG